MNFRINKPMFYLLSLTWGLPMTLLGATVSAALLLTGHRPKRWGWCWYFEAGKSWGGVELGLFFVTDRNSSDRIRCHELGHGIQNCWLGPFMPFVVCIPSAIRYWSRRVMKNRRGRQMKAYDSIWFEGQATRLGTDFMRWLSEKNGPRRLLLTAFDPFGGADINPALEAVRLVRAPEGAELIRLEVPTVYGASLETVLRAMRRERPAAVICVGQAAGRAAITPERVAINLCDSTAADNAGHKRTDRPVIADGPAAYFSNLPVKRITAAINAAGVPAALSCSAGTFVCNQLMYGVLYHISHEFPGMKGGFIHVPCIPEQTADMRDGTPSMPLDDIVKGLEAALAAVADGLAQ